MIVHNPLVPRLQIIPTERIASRIHLIRGEKVILDSDLAELYGVATKNLNRVVKRNLRRFPEDFMFQLTPEEAEFLRFQSGTLKLGRGQHRKYLPYGFTEQGVAMLSSVLSSDRAADVNVAIMRAFVKMREAMIAHKELVRRLDEIEKKYDHKFAVIFDAIRKLMEPPPVQKKSRIGYIKPRDHD
jgi:phage regulator Rha-like protein